MNAINYWNLLYLSDKLNSCHKPSEREELLKAVLHSNTHTWYTGYPNNIMAQT